MSTAPGRGTTFAGYRVEELVGRGGMGVVYRAMDLSLERPVALKLIAPELARDERFRARFLREPRLAAALDHPHVIPIHEAGEHDGQLYLAMRYVEGSDLKTVLERDGKLAPERALRVLAQIADALDAAHRRGLVHRDVKPANMLLDEDGHAYLTDFGITKQLGGAETDTGRVLGTLDYLAPEQIRGEAVDGRTDCYALGCVLYECLAGAPPFRRATEAETLWAHMQEEPAPLPDHPALDPVIEKAHAKNRDERYATCAELMQAASRALGQQLYAPHEGIIGGEPGPERPGTVETPQTAFVGRGLELAELLAGLDDAFAGRGRLFLLVGEPGIGKSRLSEELVAQARARGARILVGRCWEAGGAPAYWPWVQSLRDYLREGDPAVLRSELGTGAADLAQIVPELRARLPELQEPRPLDSEAARFRLFDATAEFLRNASASRPIVMVLDDLHAADAPSLLLLRFLARELGSARMLVLGAYRDVDPVPDGALTEMLVEVAREPVTRRISLGGLSKREVAEYVERTASEIASPGLVAALHDETDGNPLFVGEIVRLLAVESVGREAAGELRLAVPESVRDVIARRLSHLSEECSRVLVLGSVLGREFAVEGLARFAGASDDELLEMLDEAMVARVVSDVPGGPGRLRFAHVLIRDTLYESLTTARRVRLHRLALEALEALYGEEPGPHLAELAHHATAGHDFDKALHYSRRAGDRSLALLAYEEGARHYRTALEALALAADERTRCELLLSLGDAESRAGDTPGSKRAFLEAAGIARRLGLARELAHAAAGYGGRIVWGRAGDDDRLLPLLEEGLATLAEEDLDLRVRLLARLAGALRDEPVRERRDVLSREAVELARRAGSPAALAYALDGRASAIVAPDTVTECLALGTELCEVAERSGDRELVVAGCSHRYIAHMQIGDIGAAEVELDAMSRIADDLRQPARIWQACSSRAMMALAAGRLSEAERLVPQALELGERAQRGGAVPVYRMQRFTLSEFRGGLAELESAIGELVVQYPARPVFRCAVAYLHARLGRLPEARRALHDLGADDFSALPFDQEWLFGMSLLAETCALLSDEDAAGVLYGLLLPYAAFNAVDVGEGMRGSLARHLGLLASAMSRFDDAARHFDQALAMNARMGARPWLAHTQHDLAAMLLARGAADDRERAHALLEEAVATYRELGMPTWASRATALA